MTAKLKQPMVPVTAVEAMQMQDHSSKLCKMSRQRFDKEFLKALRNSKSAPPHISAQLLTLEEPSGCSTRPKTSLKPEDLASVDESETESADLSGTLNDILADRNNK